MARFNTGRVLASNLTDTSHRVARSFLQATRDFMNANVLLGAWATAAGASSKAPTLDEIRMGSSTKPGWQLDVHP
jgi:hypothetical protein